MGSKARFAKEIIRIMQHDLSKTHLYIEPFAGGMNLISNIQGVKRIANDSNPYLISMFIELQKGWEPPEYVDKEEYLYIKNSTNCPAYLKGWVGFNCSYSGKWFGGFAGVTNTKQGVRNYQHEAKKNVMTQMKNLKDVEFLNLNYNQIDIPPGSLVYCDPPYKDTTKYFESFDHGEFWNWVRETSRKSKVFVSEYSAPDDFTCIWQKQASSSLSANGVIGGNKISTERLFTLKD